HALRVAHAARVLFSAARRELLLRCSACQSLSPTARKPDPWILLTIGHDTRVPRISQDVMKLFLQIAIGPDVTVKSFLLPERSAFVLHFINSMRGERFDRV